MASFNIDDLTNQDVIDIEDATGKSFSEILNKWEFKVAVAWLALRRDNPAISYDEVKSSKLDVVMDAVADPDPKDEA